MATPVVVQTPNAVLVSGASSGNLTMGSAVTAGNSLVGAVHMTSSAARSWTVTDTVDGGSWSSTVLYQPGRSMQIHHRHTASAGTPTITWTISAGIWSGYIWACEVSGLDTGASPVTGTLDESPTTSDNHNCASSTVTATDAFVIGTGVLTAAATSTAAGATYTMAPGLTSNAPMTQYKVTASQSDTGPWTSVGTDRIGQACMAAFPAPIVVVSPPERFLVMQAVHRASTY